MTFFESLYFDYKITEEDNLKRLSLFVHPKEPITLSHVVLEIPFNFQAQDRVLCNGFQSWSATKMYSITEKIPQLRKVAKRYFQYYTDDHLFNESKPDLYSWTYGYVKQNTQCFLVGSLSEQTAFTLIEYDTNVNIIRITKQCDYIELSHSFPIFDLVINEGSEQNVFASYFNAIEPSTKSKKSTFGWTSWYRHYTDITADKIKQDLEHFATKSNISPLNEFDRIFQIDDGYQTQIGDWLSSNEGFPNGMEGLAHKIKSKGLIPGIWIAPFICSPKSKVYKDNKDWLLKDSKGQAIKAGYNPLWGGWYYALDIYNPKVKDYLTEVVFTMTKKWGYQLVKADFLFAACIAPPKDKTKAQVMHDALIFLEQLIGQNKLLTCGVPIGSGFNKSAFCRIGPDTHLTWTNPPMKFLRKRERVSTINALRTIVNRRHLNKNVFVNDPDVFIMRKEGHKFSSTQQYTILLVQVLFGSQIFNSDDWGAYEEDTIEEIRGLMQFIDPQIINVSESIPDYYIVHFLKGQNFVAHINLSKDKINATHSNSLFELGAYESIILRKN